MNHFDNSDNLSEIAAILAAGLLRLHARAALGGSEAEHSESEKPGNSDRDSLEVSQETVLSVHTGKRLSRPQERTT